MLEWGWGMTVYGRLTEKPEAIDKLKSSNVFFDRRFFIFLKMIFSLNK
jgi:hypothetical protein